MFKTLFILAYYGLFRIGELAYGDHTLKANDVHVGSNKDKILLVLYTSKMHGYDSYPQEIRISVEQGKEFNKINRKLRNFCPFKLTRKFIELHGGYCTDKEVFFTCSDGSSVTQIQVQNALHKVLHALNINPACYSFHSLRSGRSSDLLKLGYTVEQIKHIGRWKSNAVYKYLC